MNTTIKISTSTFILSGLLLITACSSSSDGGGTGGTATVPANAIVLNASNAEPAVGTSVTTVDNLDFALGIETTPAMGLRDALKLLQPRIDIAKDSLKNSGADPVYGVAVSDSGACLVSGSFSFSGDESATSDSGTVTVNNCDDGEGVVLDGSFTWSSTWNNTTGAYSDSVTGSFSIQSTTNSDFFKFGGVDYAETGNDFDFTYTVSKATFSVDFTGGNGFLVTLGAPIVESVGANFFQHCPESGRIIITGANGTTAEGIYNGDGTMTIIANGIVVDASANCVF